MDRPAQLTPGQWLYNHRTARKMTQQDVAALSGVTRQYISLLERDGKYEGTEEPIIPDVDKVDRIAAALSPHPRQAIGFQRELRTLYNYGMEGLPFTGPAGELRSFTAHVNERGEVEYGEDRPATKADIEALNARMDRLFKMMGAAQGE